MRYALSFFDLKKSQKTQKPISYGGQALLEGVMMRGKNGMALSIVAPDGEIMTETTRIKKSSGFVTALKKTPIIRGCIAFFASMKMSVSTLLKSAEVSAEKDEQPGKGWMYFSVILGLLLSVGLFIVLPFVIGDFALRTDGGMNILYRSLIESGLRLVIFVLFLFLMSRLKDIRRNFMFHGAEHKTINCYEQAIKNGEVDEEGRVLNSAITVEKVKKCSTRHNRCGTTFLFFVMIIAIVVFSITNWLFDMWGINEEALGRWGAMFSRMGIRLALLPFVAGLSFELLKLLAILPDNWFVKIFRAPGLALQRLTTYEPNDDKMLEVAIISFMAAKAMDENENITDIKFGQKTIAELREQIADEIKNTNADNSEIDWILCHVFKCKRNEISSQEKSTLDQYLSIKDILRKRKEREPLWYILGYTDFYKSRIFVNNNVLIPRNDTEILVDEAIKLISTHNAQRTTHNDWQTAEDAESGVPTEPISVGAASCRPLNVLEIGTGSGCISKALSKFTKAKIYATDVSEEVLKIARKNVGEKVLLHKGDMFEIGDPIGAATCRPLPESEENSGRSMPAPTTYDLIISNPPYIKTADIDTLDEEVKNFEPHLALDGGEDGLKYYRIFAKEAQNHLNKNGYLMLEIGFDQSEQVSELLKENFTDIKIIKDLNGLDRVIIARPTN
ncbi:MAG: peptide chain release factor N(5)-glutamine methyltransferase [Firmicutes bacterium]|nr:peptide chain release factor N(5)-glutamine methyltransferase [Bacillota bacterium]